MSNDYWIKLKEQAEQLLLNDVDAYLVMSLVMFKARENLKNQKYNSKKLPPGQAFIDDYSCLNLSRQRWRDAKDRIRDVHQIATHKGTNKGTIFTLLNTEFCDLNIEAEEPSKEPTKNQQGTNKEPPTQVNFSDDIHYKKEERRKKKEDTIVSSCSETSHSLRSEPKSDQIRFNLELATWEGITDADFDIWKQIYPNINHGQELARAAEWVRANPTKTKKLWRKFINGWFGRSETDAYIRLSRAGQEALYKGNPPPQSQLDIHYQTKKKLSSQQNNHYQDAYVKQDTRQSPAESQSFEPKFKSRNVLSS